MTVPADRRLNATGDSRDRVQHGQVAAMGSRFRRRRAFSRSPSGAGEMAAVAVGDESAKRRPVRRRHGADPREKMRLLHIRADRDRRRVPAAAAVRAAFVARARDPQLMEGQRRATKPAPAVR